jgi:hypothetical protein
MKSRRYPELAWSRVFVSQDFNTAGNGQMTSSAGL